MQARHVILLRMRLRIALACCAVLAGLVAVAQTPSAPKAKTEARYAGGFRPDACRWPREARQKQMSACCQMDLEIDANGCMVGARASAPIRCSSSRRCAASPRRSSCRPPATASPVSDLQHLEYEWRATTPPGRDLCNKLKTS